MNIEYVYLRKRTQFGKRCYFTNYSNIDVDIRSDPTLINNFIRLDPVSRGTQTEKILSLHQVNTTTATFKDGGMLHVEGGWPKDVNRDDIEQTVRYRRKIEKDDLYVHTMQQLLPSMEHCVLQNNACDIYQQYFEDIPLAHMVQQRSVRTVNVYRDPLPVTRPVTNISWSPDQGSRIAVSHCSTDFKRFANYSPISYVWDIANPNKPYAKLKPFCPILTLEFNPKDSNILGGGLMTGQVAFWDIRKGMDIVGTSLIERSHRDPCSQLIWINSKTGMEFFSASKDGQIKWWDTRKLEEPLETLVIDLTKPDEQDLDRAIGISALQFEPSIGTKFMCGLENGLVISGNRKGKTPTEKLAVRFKAQYGQVISLERNPTFLKNFLTVGDWTARVWSEDCRESCIIWTPSYGVLLTGGNWSATKYSVFSIIKMDGTVDVWDLLVQQDNPVITLKVTDKPLTCIRPHERGDLVAVGSKGGVVYLLEYSKSLVENEKNDRVLLTALFERETRREKAIEAKNRELRLKMKVRQQSTETLEQVERAVNDFKDPILAQAEQEYNAIIEAELARQIALDPNREIDDEL